MVERVTKKTMNENINLITNSLRGGEYKTNPRGCANAKAILAGEYSFFMGQLEDILTRKPAIWNRMRANHKSDTACEREWEATADGINEVVIRLKLKKIEKLISALSTLIKVAEGEALNQY